jgi:hypothetical protein
MVSAGEAGSAGEKVLAGEVVFAKGRVSELVGAPDGDPVSIPGIPF